MVLASLVWLAVAASVGTAEAARLAEFLPKLQPAEIIPGADRFGPVEGTPPAAAIYRGDRLVGYALLNGDVVAATGYSGKPIEIVVGIDAAGVIRGAKLVEHHEPIVLVGIPEAKVRAFIAGYIGINALDSFARVLAKPPVDLISGATVSTIVIGESMVRAALKVARSRGLGGAGASPSAAPTVVRRIDPNRMEPEDWTSLLGSGAVRHRLVTVAEVNRAFAASGNLAAAERPEPGPDDDAFIDLYLAEVSVPAIGASLLGPAEYANLTARLKPGQSAIVVAGHGRYSFRGSGFVRGGIFDRIQLIQDEDSLLFRDHDYKRLGDFAADGAPAFGEIGLFVVPARANFDPVAPWRLQLLVQRPIGALQKAFVTFDADYRLPDRYQIVEAPAAAIQAAPAASAAALSSPAPGLVAEPGEAPLWHRLWHSRRVDLGILAAALGGLTLVFFFQNLLVVRPRLHRWLRLGFLAFTLVWLGWTVGAQLSVVNVLAVLNSLGSGFSWDTFLLDPLIFVLWFAVAAALVLWGRGAFCGWLCPFGALQELLNQAARALKIPQLTLPWGVHERLTAIKYLVFLVLLALSLHSLGLAEQGAEVEPFKTAIVLHFQRAWPFVAFVAVLLGAGLFIERFYCRYLCPLGAALAIPARLRVFDWLRRHKECGSPCQRCARECPVGAIYPEGHINPTECIQCLNCQVTYWHEHNCPAMIQRRLKRERRETMASPEFRTAAARPGPTAAGPATAGPTYAGSTTKESRT
ncbi:MAG: 4Fe-4S binding protein [Azospirillum sp.]|nr:4Fe-4S binding protein [Azospirillum sp.]